MRKVVPRADVDNGEDADDDDDDDDDEAVSEPASEQVSLGSLLPTTLL